MKRLVLVSLLLLFVPLIFVGAVHAKNTDAPKNVVLGRDEVVNRDYFAQGNNITISGTVNGDVYAAGGKITIDGQVNGDVIAGAGIVEITGNVDEDVRVGARQVFVYGNIGGSLTAGAGNVVVDDDATIGQSVVIGAGSLRVDGLIGREATLGAGEAVLNNSIGGSVVAGVGQLTVGNSAIINGDLNYWSDSKAQIGADSKITGIVNQHLTTKNDKQRESVISVLGLSYKILSFVSTLILGLVMIRLAPVFTQDVVLNIRKKTLATLGMGVLYLILAPILFVLMLITIVGIPFAVILLFATIILLMVARVYAAMLIGKYIQEKFKMNSSDYMAYFIGLVSYVVIRQIPVLGGLFAIFATIMVVGSVVILKRTYWLNFRSKKLI